MKKTMQKTVLLFTSLFILALISSPAVLGVALGVNRADLTFEDVLRGGYAEESFVVSTDASNTITGVLEVEGNIQEWVSFVPENASEGFNFSANSPRRIMVIIQPPEDTANGEYEGTIRVLTGEIARTSDGQYGTSTRAAFKIASLVGITDVETKRCVVGGTRLSTTEIQQPIDFSYSIKNIGNVRVQPEILITIYDQAQDKVIARQPVETESQILPTTTKNFLSQIPHDLPVGQYWANVASEECSGSSLLTFDVLERGGVADFGEFVRWDAPSFVETGDIVPLTAVFRNTGSRTVSAKLKGTIMRGRKVVKVIDTDFYDTPPAGLADIESFFNPDKPGQYEISGRVLYNNKLTFPRVHILNVSGEDLSTPWSLYAPIIIVMIIVILFLLILIKRKRKRRY